ncbi:MAG: hemerythrin domain-containing protein [Deltaproteobacteria bacterium]|nr:hemerythrin domain-containing protein [Deltaproteobacteria bacterium]
MGSVVSALARGHQRILVSVRQAIQEVSTLEDGSVPTIAELVTEIRQHVNLVEEVIVPTLQAAMQGKEHSMVSCLRAEHVLLGDLCVDIEKDLRRKRWSAVLWNLAELDAALTLHGKKEQEVGPIIDQRLQPSTIRYFATLLDEK